MCPPARDLVARYGGEEFVALPPDMATEDAWVLAERLRAGVLALGLPHHASQVSPVVTLSAGLATLVPEEGRAPDALVAAADGAL